MDKKILSAILAVLIVSVIIIGGCVQQTEKTPEEKPSEKTIIKPNVTAEEVVSELQNVKSSMNELGKFLSK